MADIQTILSRLLSARYGKDVRQAIKDGIEQCYKDGKAGAVDVEMREKIMERGVSTQFVEDGAFQLPLQAINDRTTSTDGTWSSSKIAAELEDVRVDFDRTPTKGSSNVLSSGTVYDLLSALLLEDDGIDCICIGNYMIVAGSVRITNLSITESTGSVYCGAAQIAGPTDAFATTGGFPACFTSTPLYASLVPTGSTSKMWTGRVIADVGGLKDVLVFRGTVTTSDTAMTGRLFAVGKINGARQAGADVVTQALQYLGRSDSVGAQIVSIYNTFATGNTQAEDAAWCSEFASVCAHKAGIPTDVFPWFASAPKGAQKFSDIGCFYKLNDGVFQKATVINHTTANFGFQLEKETYTPRLGDVLWMSDDKGTYPEHTGIVVSTSSSDGALSLFTIEGNMGAVDGDTDKNKRTVKRMCRTVGGKSSRDKRIFAVGRVNYAEVS